MQHATRLPHGCHTARFCHTALRTAFRADFTQGPPHHPRPPPRRLAPAPIPDSPAYRMRATWHEHVVRLVYALGPDACAAARP